MENIQISAESARKITSLQNGGWDSKTDFAVEKIAKKDREIQLLKSLEVSRMNGEVLIDGFWIKEEDAKKYFGY